MKIIVVDDKKVTRKCTSRFLENMGHQCGTTSSIKEALKIIKKEGTDMVVTDLKMRKINSFELLKILKNTYPKIKIALLTGLANLESAEEDVPLLFLNKGSWKDLKVNGHAT